jgi:hypothetical protein
MRVVRARVKRGQKLVKEASPGAIDPAAALSPTIITLAGHVALLQTVILKPKIVYVWGAHLFVAVTCNMYSYLCH